MAIPGSIAIGDVQQTIPGASKSLEFSVAVTQSRPPKHRPFSPSLQLSRGPVEQQDLAPIEGGGEVIQNPDVSPIQTVPSGRNWDQTVPANNSANQSSGGRFSDDIWRGLTVETAESWLNKQQGSPRSRVLHDLWRRLLITNARPPSGASNEAFQAVKVRALQRAGLLRDVIAITNKNAATKSAVARSVLNLFRAAGFLGLNNFEQACALARDLTAANSPLPFGLKGDAILITGFCALANGNRAAAGLTADLAREAGVEASLSLRALDAIASGRQPKRPRRKTKISLIDYHILSAANAAPKLSNFANADPALLVSLTKNSKLSALTRAGAGEAAFTINAIDSKAMAKLYAAVAAAGGNNSAAQDEVARRAVHFSSADNAQTPRERIKRIGTFLNAAQESAFYDAALRLAFELSQRIEANRDTISFAPLAIMLALNANRADYAARWFNEVMSNPGSIETGIAHWGGLIDIAGNGDGNHQSNQHTKSDIWQSNVANDAGSENPNLTSLERVARTGGLKPRLLHKLVTVLDALAYNVPIPLWDLASRTPQPSDGFLPPTGVLSQLKEATRNRELARTVMLAIQTSGPEGPSRTHMIGLGDIIRALKRVGLETEARKFALEALLPDWPLLID